MRIPLQKLNNRKVFSFVVTLLDQVVTSFGKTCKPESLNLTLLNTVYILSIRKSLLSASNMQQLGRVCTGRLPLIQALSLEVSSTRNGTIGYDLGFICLTCTKDRQQDEKKQVLVCLSCAQRCHVGHFMLPLGYEQDFLCHCNLLTDKCICSDD